MASFDNLRADHEKIITPRSWMIKLPAGSKLLTANDLRRLKHWSHYNATIRDLRRMTNMLACQKRIPKLLPKIKVIATYHPPDNRRRDSTQNIFPSTKACIDGLVDAQVIKDDNDKIVVSVEMLRGENVKGGQLVIEVVEVLSGGNA